MYRNEALEALDLLEKRSISPCQVAPGLQLQGARYLGSRPRASVELQDKVNISIWARGPGCAPERLRSKLRKSFKMRISASVAFVRSPASHPNGWVRP